MSKEQVTLYNKYRPKRFDEIIGQANTVKAIQEGVANHKLPHTLLFQGPRGTGKTTTARIVARALNCSSPRDGEPCGECESCSFPIDAMPGYYEYDAASHSGVAEARTIVDAINSGNPIAKNQIFVIDEVHSFSPQAQEALLKSTEEPPPGTYVIFATTDPERLIPTTRSRSTMFPFTEVNDEDIATLIERVVEAEGEEISEDTLMGVISEGDGSPRDSLSVLQRVLLGGSVTTSGKGLELATAIVTLDTVGALVAVAEVVRDGGSVYTLNIETLSFLRDMMIAPSAPKLVSKRRLREIEEHVTLSTEVSSRARRAIPSISSVARVMRTASEPRGLFESEIIGFIFDEQKVDSGQAPALGTSYDRLESKIDALFDIIQASCGNFWPGVDNASQGRQSSSKESPIKKKPLEQARRIEEVESAVEVIEEDSSEETDSSAEVFSAESFRLALEKQLPARFSSRLSLISIQESNEDDDTVEVFYETNPGIRWPSNLKEAVMEIAKRVLPEGYEIDLLYPSEDGFWDLES